MTTTVPSATTYLSIDQAASIVGCSKDTIRREISRGRLKARKFGRLIRIEPDDLARAMKPVTRLDLSTAGVSAR